ncbi:MAG: hypothetical protein IJW49_01080 [Clostridia bacterium]|nr:hypothetical protein [Clostridia bacterium]
MWGSSDIPTTIFEKINDSDLFIADISIINKSKLGIFQGKYKPTPNPNVLIELGYAACALGWDRIICVYNTDYSKLEALPFDLRQHRITAYSLKRKNKSEERQGIVNAFSATIDGLLKSGNAVRPKGTNSLHRLFGFDIQSESLSQNVIAHEIPFSRARQERIEMCKQIVEKLNASQINFSRNACLNDEFDDVDFTMPTIIDITAEEQNEVINITKKLLDVDLSEAAFRFGNLKHRNVFSQALYDLDGNEQEKQKYRDYSLLKRMLSEIMILDMFCRPFENILVIPLAIKNISKSLDKNINIVITVEGDDFELISPTRELIDKELGHNSGFVCEYGFIVELFSMKESHKIKYDEDDSEIYDYQNDHSYTNLWDGATSWDEDDCLGLLSDYVATQSSNNVLEFKINSLQADETKWLDQLILIKIQSGKIKLNYYIKSDNTDGGVSGNISQSN